MMGRTLLGCVVFALTAGAAVFEGGKVLIIAEDPLVGAVQPLADWKTRKGLMATIVRQSEAGGTADEIQAFVRNAYETWHVRPEYLLIVGSPTMIPSYQDEDEEYQDCFYGNMSGSHVMEISVGRLPAWNVHECSTMVAKIMAYERPPTPGDTVWYRKGTTAVREDGDNDDSTYWNDSRLAHGYWQSDSFVHIDSFSKVRGDSSDSINAAASDGRAFLTYRGGAVTNWWPPFDAVNPAQWNNGARLPIIVSGSCATVALRPGETMQGDAWVRYGTPGDLGGAIAYFGTTRVGEGLASSRGACFRGFFRALFALDSFRLGPATLHARSCTLGIVARYTEWNLLGDPSMFIWVGGVPKAATVNAPDTIGPEATVQVTVTTGGRSVRGALVCLMKQPDLYATGTTDTQGVATIQLPPHMAGAVFLTVSEGHAVGTPRTPILPFEDTTWTTGRAGWVERAQVRDDPSGKAVKAGGWLTYCDSAGLVFSAKGNKVPDFYSYDPVRDTWAKCHGIPWGCENKYPGKGCRGASDGGDYVYMTKGNNTLGFWRYSVSADSWAQLSDVPLGVDNRKVKDGSDLAFAVLSDTGYVYLLKGNRFEFYRFNCTAQRWETLAAAPGYPHKWYEGSFLAYDGDHTIYAHKAKSHELWKYDTEGHTWCGGLSGMPLYGNSGRKKKSKDGGAAAWRDSAIYALKGGNTQEFWKYCPDGDTWCELETIPQRASYSSQGRKAHAGADIGAMPGFGLYALKGNRTLEFWRYVPGGSGAPPGEDNSPPPGENELLVANGPCCATPAFSHSGLFIAFTKPGPGPNGHSQVFKALANGGGGVQQLTQVQAGSCLSPAWYYDDSKLALIVEPDTGASKIGVVSSMGGPVVYLSSVTGDIEDFAWSPSGNSLDFSRSDSGDFTQLWTCPLNGGSASELTTSSNDHFQPHFASESTIVFRLDPPDAPSQIGKLYKYHSDTTNLSAYVWKETTLTSTEHEHSAPCVAGSAGPVFFEVDTGGFTGLGRVKLNGDSECVIAASNGYDFEMPTTGPLGETLYCLRSTDAGAAVCEVYADGSGYDVLTDDEVERETPHARQNSGSPACATYIRDGSVYRTLGHGEEGGQGGVLGVLALEYMRPNPTLGRTVIHWQVPRLTSVSLKLYNAAGQLVKTLVEGETKPGRYVTAWDGTDRRGRRVASGVYFCALEADRTRLNRKVVLTASE
jgi:hypothetical protein